MKDRFRGLHHFLIVSLHDVETATGGITSSFVASASPTVLSVTAAELWDDMKVLPLSAASPVDGDPPLIALGTTDLFTEAAVIDASRFSIWNSCNKDCCLDFSK